jgi:hypothetical protein
MLLLLLTFMLPCLISLAAAPAAAAAAAAAAEKYFTLGDHPIRVAGMKVYSTAEDTCIMEMPMIWGSNAVVSYPQLTYYLLRLSKLLHYENATRLGQQCSGGPVKAV